MYLVAHDFFIFHADKIPVIYMFYIEQCDANGQTI